MTSSVTLSAQVLEESAGHYRLRLNTGFGVQSVTIAAMSCLGDLPMPDFSVFAAGWESADTYAYKAWFTGWAAARGLRIVTLMGDVRRVELFARQRAPGWDAWGNQVESNVAL